MTENIIARVLAAALVSTLLCSGLAVAEVEKGDRAGQKVVPPEEAGKGADRDGKREDEGGDHPAGNPVDRVTELLDDVRENMSEIEKLLSDRKTGPSTQSAAHSVVEKLDRLIREIESSCSGSGGSGAPKPSSQQQKQQGSQQRSEKQPGLQKEQQAKQQQQARKPEGNQEVPPTGRQKGPVPPAKVAGPLEGKPGVGQWGKLPWTEIQEMLDSGEERIPPKYREIITRYYLRLGEAHESGPGR